MNQQDGIGHHRSVGPFIGHLHIAPVPGGESVSADPDPFASGLSRHDDFTRPNACPTRFLAVVYGDRKQGRAARYFRNVQVYVVQPFRHDLRYVAHRFRKRAGRSVRKIIGTVRPPWIRDRFPFAVHDNRRRIAVIDENIGQAPVCERIAE